MNRKAFICCVALLSLTSKAELHSKFKKDLLTEKTNYLKLLSNTKQIDINSLNNYDSFNFNKSFLKHVLTYTPTRFLILGRKDKCSFYDLILSNTLKDYSGTIQKFIIEVTKGKNTYKGHISRKDFIQKIIERECPQSIKFAKYFSLKNLKRTLSSFKLDVPKSVEQCRQIHQELINDHKTPYLCYLQAEIKKVQGLENRIALTPSSDFQKLASLKSELRKSKTIKSFFSESSMSYLANMCQNIEKEKLFCNQFFDDSFYKKIKEKSASHVYVQNHCKELFKTFNKSSLDVCLDQLVRLPKSCYNLNRYDHALLPKPDCSQISSALNHSKLRTSYIDCPGRVANETILNISRLLRHFSKEEFEKEQDCRASSLSPYANHNTSVNGKQAWKTQACYMDKIRGEEVCFPTLFISSNNIDVSLSENIKKILIKVRGMSKKDSCRVITRKVYNPVLLEFQSGCYIVKETKDCQDCTPRIIFDQEDIKFITFKNSFDDEYFASDYLIESRSQNKILQKQLNLKSKIIPNTTILKEHFKNRANSVLHGVGCIEKIYPDLFVEDKLNQCRPVAFIIDGHIEQAGVYSMILRTSIDSLHSPRIVPWGQIFDAVKSFQKIHPLNKWTLHALYR